MRSNSRNLGLEQERTDLLKRQLSHRSFRKQPEDGYKDFAMWVRRGPALPRERVMEVCFSIEP